MIMLLFQMNQHLNLERREKRKHVTAESGRVDRHSCTRPPKLGRASFFLQYTPTSKRGSILSLLGRILNYNKDVKEEDILATAFH
jgi:hypothetical protein